MTCDNYGSIEQPSTAILTVRPLVVATILVIPHLDNLPLSDHSVKKEYTILLKYISPRLCDNSTHCTVSIHSQQLIKG